MFSCNLAWWEEKGKGWGCGIWSWVPYYIISWVPCYIISMLAASGVTYAVHPSLLPTSPATCPHPLSCPLRLLTPVLSTPCLVSTFAFSLGWPLLPLHLSECFLQHFVLFFKVTKPNATMSLSLQFLHARRMLLWIFFPSSSKYLHQFLFSLWSQLSKDL